MDVSKRKGDGMTDFRKTWEVYARSWGEGNEKMRTDLYTESLDPGCVYADPQTERTGWEELAEWMTEFQRQFPGGYFETVYFQAHHGKSIAHWEMKDADGITLDQGTSFGEYTDSGKLIRMTGFYKTTG